MAAWRIYQETLAWLQAALAGGGAAVAPPASSPAPQENQLPQLAQQRQQAGKRAGGDVIDLTGDSPATRKRRV